MHTQKLNFTALHSRYFLIFIPVVKIYKKDFSQEKSDSSNFFLSLMKRIEDVIIL